MSKVTISTPTQTFEFEADFVSEHCKNIDNLMLTVVDVGADVVHDFPIKDVKCSKSEDGVGFNAAEMPESVGIFTLINFLYGNDCETLLELFEKYDGTILAYNEKDILTSPREEILTKSTGKKVYIITGYDNAEFPGDANN